MKHVPATDEDSLRWLLLRTDIPWDRMRTEYADHGMVAAVKKLQEVAPDEHLSTLVAAITMIEEGLVDYTLPVWESKVLRDQVRAAVLIMGREHLKSALSSLRAAQKINLRDYAGIDTAVVKTEKLLFRLCTELSEVNKKLDRDPRDAWDGVDNADRDREDQSMA